MYVISNFFMGQKVSIDIQGKGKEKANFSRVGKTGSSNFKSNFVYSCLLQDDTKLENGDIFTAKTGIQRRESVFMVISVRRSDVSVQATVYRCNGEAEVWRATPQYDEFDQEIGSELALVGKIPVNHVTVNAKMRLIDAGLLPSTTKEFRMPITDIQEMDRIILDGQSYCVDAIDKTKFDGLLAVQTSNDNRTL